MAALNTVQFNAKKFDKKITLAITGASGSAYALRLLECLLAANYQVYLLCSSAGRIVLDTELDFKLPASPDVASALLVEKYQAKAEQIIVFGKSSGSRQLLLAPLHLSKWWLCPCSTGTLAAISQGLSDNLIERAADVVIKERGQLILMVRETPLSTIHTH